MEPTPRWHQETQERCVQTSLMSISSVLLLISNSESTAFIGKNELPEDTALPVHISISNTHLHG